jgi:uncharacterized protein (TIRG00374 family)
VASITLSAPPPQTFFIAGVIVAGVLVASLVITQRDVWVPVLARHRRGLYWALGGGLFAIVVTFAASHIGDVESVLRRIAGGDPLWLVLAGLLEVISFAGYMVLTHAVYRPRAAVIDWPASVEMTLAGVVATRIFSAGGAGGIAFTAWVLTRAGMDGRTAARRLSAFMILLYSVYVGSLLIGGALVVAGIVGDVPEGLGVVAFLVGGSVTVIFLLILRIPPDIERRAHEVAERGGRLSGIAARLAAAPQVAGAATRLALQLWREDRSVIAWPLVWWAFDVAVLWAAFKAFGSPPPIAAVILCYFLGSLGNLLPLPGGVGGAEGGMLGAFVASGVDAGLALVAVITYQVISTYMPALPGLAAYVSLKRRMDGWREAGPALGPGQTAVAGEPARVI